MKNLAVFVPSGLPDFISGVPSDSIFAASIGRLFTVILGVLESSHDTKVAEDIIESVAVDVVNFEAKNFNPMHGHDDPSCKKLLPVDCDTNVPLAATSFENPASALSCPLVVPFSNVILGRMIGLISKAPKEMTHYRLIAQEAIKGFLCEHKVCIRAFSAPRKLIRI